ncbi:hypothetical protein AV530_012137 [Patagioenas fasciata monilis]|uniref:Uncharacterized protein n=1 Tax=Patagioenas fasciata monilis TaxID=372326 RepID=A0A1V4JV45_PATFA|nr:hypothetical protein AV530_012137 [Patagioenas fasciata monilis]
MRLFQSNHPCSEKHVNTHEHTLLSKDRRIWKGAGSAALATGTGAWLPSCWWRASECPPGGFFGNMIWNAVTPLLKELVPGMQIRLTINAEVFKDSLENLAVL